MTIYLLHIFCIVVIVAISNRKKFENALPFVCFVILIAPGSLRITIPGLFDLNLQRTIIFTLFLIFMVTKKNNSEILYKDNLLRNFFIASIAANLFALIFSVVPIISFKRFISEVIEYYLLYLIIIRTVSDTDTIHKIMIAMVAAMAICSVFGMVEAYTNWQVMPEQVGRFADRHGGTGMWSSGRIRSVFPHPILFGGAIAMIMPLTLYLLTYVKKNSYKTLIWISVALMFLSEYKTLSRGPWLSVICSLVLIFFLSNKEFRKPILFIGLLSLATIILRPGVWETVENLAIATFSPDTPKGSSYDYRYVLSDVIRQSLSKSFTRQLFGYGQGSFFYLNLVADFHGRPYAFQSCDSAWLQFLSNTGYIGFITMILLFGKATIIIWFNFLKSTNSDRNFFLATFSSLFGTYLLMASVALYGWGQSGHILWIIIAISFSYAKLINNEKDVNALVKTM